MKNRDYDTALLRLQAIVEQLERGEAVSLEEYRHLADEAKQLLQYCRTQLTEMEEAAKAVFSEEER